MHVHILKDWFFTPSETRIFISLVKGMTDKRIAIEHKLSTKTVAAHCHNIYEKLEISSQEFNPRCAAVSWAIAKQIITIEGNDD